MAWAEECGAVADGRRCGELEAEEDRVVVSKGLELSKCGASRNPAPLPTTTTPLLLGFAKGGG